MKYFAILAVIMVLAMFAVWHIGGPRGPKLKDVSYLKNPRIAERSSQKVLTVDLLGDPVNTFKMGCKPLFKAYFQIPGVSKGFKSPYLIARWPKPFDTPRNEWLGRFAIPVPDNTTAIPRVPEVQGSKLTLTVWDGGTVAEILHVGPYSTETVTIEKLHKFIIDSGYVICGEHEEEYLRSSGMWFKGDSSTYLTIIRYRVKKIQS